MPLGGRIFPSEPNQSKSVPTNGPDGSHGENANADFTLFYPENPKFCFDDMVLNQQVYDMIQDVLAIYEKHDLLFNQWGLSERQKSQNRAGINLYGPSGTGKTMAAHAIANQLGRKILTVDYSQIESKYVGETSKNLAAMFNYAKTTNSVIFFDEADALLSKRVTNMSSATDVSVNQTRSVLLVLINEYDDLILFATNFITNYDPAFMRRILAHVKFDLPDEKSREKLWSMYIPEKMPTDVDIKVLASKYSGITGSDISNAVLNASLHAARMDERIVHHSYFDEAIEHIVRGRADNDDMGVIESRRTVSEEYVKQQFGGRLPK